VNLIKKYGLSTYHGTNCVAILLAAMEYSRDFDEETRKWLLPTLWGLLILTFWLIRGNTAPAVADELNEIGHDDIQDVLKRGRE
jgi:cytosine/uracil/thiamine/allantoin permease